MKQLTLSELADLLLQGDNYIMLTHRRPDGDTIGSAVALCRGLRQLGKTAYVLENPQFTPKYRPFLEGLTVESVPDGATLVSVDTASEGLLAFNAVDYVNQILYSVDHHGRNSGFAAQGYVDPDMAACGEIIFDLLLEMDAEIDKEIAEALYVAVSTDTGCFRYSNTTEHTFMVASACKARGADIFSINKTFFMTKRFARLKLDAYLTETTEFYADGLVAVSQIPNVVRRELGVTEDDIDDISGFGRDIEGVEIGIMIRQEVEGGKLSVRTSPNYDASLICAKLGGGGHKAAAGATIAGGIEEAKAAVLAVLREMELI